MKQPACAVNWENLAKLIGCSVEEVRTHKLVNMFIAEQNREKELTERFDEDHADWIFGIEDE